MTEEDLDELEAKKPPPAPKPRHIRIPGLTIIERFHREDIPSMDEMDETLGHLDRDVLWRFKRSLDL
jgi:hypothetical protein